MHQAVASGKEKIASARIENPLQRVFSRIETMSKPVIACINGHALGGGCEIALACHYRLMASDQGTIGLTEVNLGIIPAAGETQRILRLLGAAGALPLLLESKRLKPEEAKELGLVHALYPKMDLFDACLGLAKRLAAQPPVAVAALLRCVREGGDLPLEKGLEIETEGFVQCIQTEDALEGFQTFFEKRKPCFKGK
jgi:enoyl-CoA hydratase/carnithine racemase